MAPAHDTVVFLGPSLPRDEARQLLPADYRPPARRGDVYACFGTGLRRVLLIDGLFHGAPSVWQRELLAALDEGIEVLGASSMGALRAVELERYGMVGWGTVFAWYRDGVIDGDDEVALLHGDAESGFRPLSEPLVNLRATLARAVTDEVLTAEEALQLAAEAKATYYPSRSVPGLTRGAAARGWSEERRLEVDRRLRAGRVDVKRADARRLLSHCAVHPAQDRERVVPSRDAHADARAGGRVVAQGMTGDALLTLASVRGAVAPLVKSLGRRWYALQWARVRGVVCPPDHVAAFRRRYESSRGATDLRAWLRERRVTEGEYEAWLEEGALLDWLSRQSDLAPGENEEARLEALARAWLRDWGIDEPELPQPGALGFRWPGYPAMLVELLLTGEADVLLGRAP